MPLPVFTRTNTASAGHQDPNSRLLLTREDSPSANTKADSDSPLPKLSDEAAIGITVGIVGIVIVLLIMWYLRHRSKKRRAGDARRSEVEKWDPVEGPAASPSRGWVDVDVEGQAAEERPAPPRFEMNGQAHAGRVWGAPKWNAVAERMAQHEEALREASAGARRGGRLSKPPLVVTRRPTGEEVRQQDVGPKGGPYVAMLWAPGHGGTLR